MWCSRISFSITRRENWKKMKKVPKMHRWISAQQNWHENPSLQSANKIHSCTQIISRGVGPPLGGERETCIFQQQRFPIPHFRESSSPIKTWQSKFKSHKIRGDFLVSWISQWRTSLKILYLWKWTLHFLIHFLLPFCFLWLGLKSHRNLESFRHDTIYPYDLDYFQFLAASRDRISSSEIFLLLNSTSRCWCCSPLAWFSMSEELRNTTSQTRHLTRFLLSGEWK